MNEATYYHIFQACLRYSLFCLSEYSCLPFRNVCIGCKLILHFNCGVLNLYYHSFTVLTHKDVLCCLFYG